MQTNKELTVNPLEVFRLRKLQFPPAHFEYVDITTSYNLKDAVEKWIEHNLKNRYYIGKGLFIDSENKIAPSLKVGFEEPKELSYFMLACPHLKYK